MSALLDLLDRFPNCRVTIRSGPTRPQPREGQLKVTKKHGRQIRRQQRAWGPGGKCIGYMVRNGRPRWEWVAESEFDAFTLRCFARTRVERGEPL